MARSSISLGTNVIWASHSEYNTVRGRISINNLIVSERKNLLKVGERGNAIRLTEPLKLVDVELRPDVECTNNCRQAQGVVCRCSCGGNNHAVLSGRASYG